MNRVRIIQIFAWTCFNTCLYSQSRPYLAKDSVSIYNADQFILGAFQKTKPDTLWSHGPFQYQLFPMGQYASPMPLLFFQNVFPDQIGFRFQKYTLSRTAFEDSSIQVFRPQSIAVQIQAMAGSADFQNLLLNWTQALHPSVTYRLLLERFSGLGVYKNQKTNSTQLDFTCFLHPAQKPYAAWLRVFSASLKRQENGGIEKAYATDSIANYNTVLVPAYLSNASAQQSLKIFETGFWHQPLRYSKVKTGWTVKYTQRTIQYTDAGIATDGFYTTFLKDSLKTKDSIRHESLHTGPFLHYTSSNGLQNATLRYHIEYEHVYFVPDRYLLNQSIKANYNLSTLDSSWQTQVKAQYYVNGYNQGDFKLQNNLFKKFKSGGIELELNHIKRWPNDQFRWYSANQFFWNFTQRFKQEQWTRIVCKAKHQSGWELSGGISQILQYTFFGADAQPFQAPSAIWLHHLQLMGHHELNAHLGSQICLGYQQTNAPNQLPLAPLYASGMMYLQGAVFKNNLLVRCGIQGRYMASFESPAYMPALQNFYISKTGFKSSSLPWIDLFFSGRIRPVNFFVRIENILFGILPSNQSLIEGYPIPGRVFRMGLQWPFWD